MRIKYDGQIRKGQKRWGRNEIEFFGPESFDCFKVGVVMCNSLAVSRFFTPPVFA